MPGMTAKAAAATTATKLRTRAQTSRQCGICRLLKLLLRMQPASCLPGRQGRPGAAWSAQQLQHPLFRSVNVRKWSRKKLKAEGMRPRQAALNRGGGPAFRILQENMISESMPVKCHLFSLQQEVERKKGPESGTCLHLSRLDLYCCTG